MTKRPYNPLTEAMDDLVAEAGRSRSYWTVQADDRDPFRMDKDANHRDCAWVREAWDSRGVTIPLHPRGIHYSLIGEPMPEGVKRTGKYRASEYDRRYEVYDNTVWHADWSERALKIAPWLGYIPFEWVKEERNREPIARKWEEQDAPERWIHQGSADDAVETLRDVVMPTADELRPTPVLTDFVMAQPFQIALFGEKTSLYDILGPIAENLGCHLFLAKGDLTNYLVHRIAEIGGDEDLRPMQILYFSDSDPSGNNMSKVLGNKLIGLKMMKFPEFRFQVHRVGLLPSQVLEYRERGMGLTESPLKEGESRADAWYAATGTYQTEIDSLITFYPEELERMAIEAINQFRDQGLERRLNVIAQGWRRQAVEVIAVHDDKAQQRADVAMQLGRIEDEIARLTEEAQALSDSVAIDTDGIELPPLPDLPDYELDWDNLPEPLVDSDWPFKVQKLALLEAKAFRR